MLYILLRLAAFSEINGYWRVDCCNKRNYHEVNQFWKGQEFVHEVFSGHSNFVVLQAKLDKLADRSIAIQNSNNSNNKKQLRQGQMTWQYSNMVLMSCSCLIFLFRWQYLQLNFRLRSNSSCMLNMVYLNIILLTIKAISVLKHKSISNEFVFPKLIRL